MKKSIFNIVFSIQIIVLFLFLQNVSLNSQCSAKSNSKFPITIKDLYHAQRSEESCYLLIDQLEKYHDQSEKLRSEDSKYRYHVIKALLYRRLAELKSQHVPSLVLERLQEITLDHLMIAKQFVASDPANQPNAKKITEKNLLEALSDYWERSYLKMKSYRNPHILYTTHLTDFFSEHSQTLNEFAGRQQKMEMTRNYILTMLFNYFLQNKSPEL